MITVLNDTDRGATTLVVNSPDPIARAGIVVLPEDFRVTYIISAPEAGPHYTLELDSSLPLNVRHDTEVTIYDNTLNFYHKVTDPDASDWELVKFNDVKNHIMLKNLTDADIEFSFNGIDTQAELESNALMVMDNCTHHLIFYKGTGTGKLIIMAWKNANIVQVR